MAFRKPFACKSSKSIKHSFVHCFRLFFFKFRIEILSHDCFAVVVACCFFSAAQFNRNSSKCNKYRFDYKTESGLHERTSKYTKTIRSSLSLYPKNHIYMFHSGYCGSEPNRTDNIVLMSRHHLRCRSHIAIIVVVVAVVVVVVNSFKMYGVRFTTAFVRS